MSDLVNLDRTNRVYRAVQPPPGRPDRSLAAIALLAVLSLVGIWALLPSSEEKAAGLYEDARYEDAIAMLVAVEDERFLNAYESYMLFKLYVQTKQPDNAAMVLQREPALQAETDWALRQLGALYREARDFAREAAVLRQLYDLNAGSQDFARLRILYRLTGDAAREATLLAQFVATGHAGPSEIERLAYLRAQPETSTASAIWVAPTSSFSSLAVPYQVLALSELAPPTTLSLE